MSQPRHGKILPRGDRHVENLAAVTETQEMAIHSLKKSGSILSLVESASQLFPCTTAPDLEVTPSQ